MDSEMNTITEKLELLHLGSDPFLDACAGILASPTTFLYGARCSIDALDAMLGYRASAVEYSRAYDRVVTNGGRRWPDYLESSRRYPFPTLSAW